MNTNLHLNPNLLSEDIEQLPTRDGFGNGLVALGEQNDQVVALTGDLSDSTRVLAFAKKFPERFVECGVAEQNMMGVAAGMALAGKIPFATSYATFSPGRNWDQLRVSVCYSEANVKVIGAHSGISVGPDGATHQALEDIAITRVLPNLTVIVPIDSIQAQKATMAIGEMKGPAYLRLTREKTPVITSEETEFTIGKAQVIKDGTDICLVGSGPILYNGIKAAFELEKEGISVMVINNHTIKPIDAETIIAGAKKTGLVITLEEHQIDGGCGSAVMEVLAENYPVPVKRLGLQNHFGESGEPDQLIKKYKLDSENIKLSIKNEISKHKK